MTPEEQAAVEVAAGAAAAAEAAVARTLRLQTEAGPRRRVREYFAVKAVGRGGGAAKGAARGGQGAGAGAEAESSPPLSLGELGLEFTVRRCR